MKHRIRKVSVIAALLVATAGGAAAFPFNSGHFYGTRPAKAPNPLDPMDLPWTWRLFQYRADGTIHSGPEIGAIIVEPPGTEIQTSGIAFGPDNLLYMVTHPFAQARYSVLAFDGGGNVLATYIQPNANAGGVTSFGKILIEQDGTFFVSEGRGLTRFEIGDTMTRTKIYDAEAVYGVTRLPSGNLMLALGDELQEITPAGVPVIPQPTFSDPSNLTGGRLALRSLRDVLYHPGENALFVSLFGQSLFEDKILKFDWDSGHLEAITEYNTPDDLALLADGSILLGSSGQAPARFDKDLNLVDLFEGDEDEDRQFVAPYPGVFTGFSPTAEAPTIDIAARPDGDVDIIWSSRNDHNYVVEGTNTLRTWDAASAAMPGTGETMSYTASPGGYRIFRVRATRN